MLRREINIPYLFENVQFKSFDLSIAWQPTNYTYYLTVLRDKSGNGVDLEMTLNAKSHFLEIILNNPN